MKALIACAAIAAASLAGGPAHAQAPAYRFPDVTTLVGPGSSIGVRVRELTVEEAKASAGVYVEEVMPSTPADRAQFRKGDVVVEFDGERVRSVRGFRRLVSETPPQRTVRAVVLRDGSRRTLDVTPEAGRAATLGDINLPDVFLRGRERQTPVPPIPQGALRNRGGIGVTLDQLDGQMADYFGVTAGVLVTAVDRDSPASRAGVKAGDVITEVEGRAVRTPSEVSDAVRRTEPGSTLPLKVVRDKREMTISIDMPAGPPLQL